MVNNSELSNMHFKKEQEYNLAVCYVKGRKPDLGRIQKGRKLNTMVKREGFKKLQKSELPPPLIIGHM